MNQPIKIVSFLIASCIINCSYLYSDPAQESSSVVKVNSVEQCQQYIKDNPIVIVYFYNTRCVSCKRTAPIIELSAITNYDNYLFLKVDTDDVAGVADAFTLRAVPTILFFKNGIEVKDRKNTVSLTDFQEIINSLKETL